MQESAMADIIVDARGLSCPLPILKARRALRELPSGATVEVLSTDPGSAEDFPSYCQSTGHILLEATLVDDAFRFVIKKGEV
jgi:tRNA 2-thiouridine synthesizing protein A